MLRAFGPLAQWRVCSVAASGLVYVAWQYGHVYMLCSYSVIDVTQCRPPSLAVQYQPGSVAVAVRRPAAASSRISDPIRSERTAFASEARRVACGAICPTACCIVYMSMYTARKAGREDKIDTPLHFVHGA